MRSAASSRSFAERDRGGAGRASALIAAASRGKGAAPGERETGRSRPAIAITWDGSSQYWVQPIWTAAALEDTPASRP
jgi:hypothetical protein